MLDCLPARLQPLMCPFSPLPYNERHHPRSFILKSAEAATAADWDAALGSNVKGYGLTTKYAIKAMRASHEPPKDGDGSRTRPGEANRGWTA